MDILHWITFEPFLHYGLNVWIAIIFLLAILIGFTIRTIPRKIISKNPEQTNYEDNGKTNILKLINYITNYIHQVVVFINSVSNIWKPYLSSQINGSRKIKSNEIGLNIVNRPIQKSLNNIPMDSLHPHKSITKDNSKQPKENLTINLPF